jgi:hypothetical protein
MKGKIMAQGVSLTYDQQVYYVAEAIANASGTLRTVTAEAAAYALSLAHSKSAVEVSEDLARQLKNL